MSERIDKLKDAVQVSHRCKATHFKSVPVHEAFRGQTVWDGVVEIFDIEGHAKAKRCYAWSYPDKGTTQFVTVLEIPPVESVETAVRAGIMYQAKKA